MLLTSARIATAAASVVVAIGASMDIAGFSGTNTKNPVAKAILDVLG